MPIARSFNPEFVLVSAGFDGASGHSPKLGGYDISAACESFFADHRLLLLRYLWCFRSGYGEMTRSLMALANGKVVLALEGGYVESSICDCAEICVRALLNQNVTSATNSAAIKGIAHCVFGCRLRPSATSS